MEKSHFYIRRVWMSFYECFQLFFFVCELLLFLFYLASVLIAWSKRQELRMAKDEFPSILQLYVKD
jgi:hypothetical protein